MSSATIVPFTPTLVRFPQPKRWTVAEFHAICGQPAFEHRRMVLIEGEILEMPVPNPPHNASVSLTDDALRAAFGAGFFVRSQMPLVLGLSTDPMPDLAVIAGSPRDFSKVHPRTAALVVEIAESSLGYDTHEKANVYAAGGIAEYWVVDLVHRQLHVFRDPIVAAPQPFGASYRSRQSLDAAAHISPLAAAGSVVAVGALLP
jgi:Uma2 family endonuclease